MDIKSLEKDYIEQSEIAKEALRKCNEIKGVYWKDFFEKIIPELEEFHAVENAVFDSLSISKIRVDPILHGYLEELQICYEINGEYKNLYIGLVLMGDDEVENFNRYYNNAISGINGQLALVERNILLLFKEKQASTNIFKLDSTSIYYK